MPKYIQLSDDGVAVGVTESDRELLSSKVVAWASGDPHSVLGKRYVDGQGFVLVEVSRKDAIKAQLADIDAKTGMPRLLRETLIAIAGDKAPAILKTHETNAAALRAEMAGIK